MSVVKLGECGLSYAAVSVMGPQSSGAHRVPVKGFKVSLAVNLISIFTLYGFCREEHATESFISSE